MTTGMDLSRHPRSTRPYTFVMVRTALMGPMEPRGLLELTALMGPMEPRGLLELTVLTALTA